jgi:hypothetical protein
MVAMVTYFFPNFFVKYEHLGLKNPDASASSLFDK